MDLFIMGATSFLTVFTYQIGRYMGKKEGLNAALELIQRRLTWTRNVSAAKVYRTLWPKAGYTSEDDAHEAGFYAGYNAHKRSAEEVCSNSDN